MRKRKKMQHLKKRDIRDFLRDRFVKADMSSDSAGSVSSKFADKARIRFAIDLAKDFAM